MIYVTVRRNPKEKQITWLDLFNHPEIQYNDLVSDGPASTVTRVLEEPTPALLSQINIPNMIECLQKFNEYHKELFETNKKEMYHHFCIPKKSGGLRPIDAPCDRLQNALQELKDILSDRFGVLYHTSGFAYIKGRCTVQQVKKHQANESNWFYHTDASGFFPSTTLEFTMRMLKMIFPLSEICRVPEGYAALEKAISLGFLNGGLPQGTKLSPYLTNVISIPIDHRIFNDLAHRHYVYTRYADDIHISCVQSFDPDKMTKYIEKVFREFGAPWKLKPEKTHYGSRKGRNYMLGLCLNAENKITVGHENKKLFKAMTTNLIMDWKNGKPWPPEDVQTYAGLLSYYKMVEKDYFKENIIAHFNQKFKVDLDQVIKDMLESRTRF